MKNFPEFETESMGGCEGFKFIPFVNANTLAKTTTTNELTTEIEPTEDNAIYEGLAVLDTLDFVEDQPDVKAGGMYKTTVIGLVPKLTSEYITLFDEMKQHRHYVLVTDNNGNIRVVGYENGATFKYKQVTGKNPATSNGFSFEFYSESRKPSPFYVV